MAKVKQFFSQFGVTVLLVALCLYLILQLTMGIGEVAEVEQTSFTTVQDTVQLEAYLFRDETLLYSGAEGINCFLVEDGDRIAKDTQVAVTYTNENDAGIQERITRINRMIRVLERSNLTDGVQITDLSVLDKNIQTLNVELLRAVADNDLAAAMRCEEELWVQMNRRQALLDEDHDYSAQINLLKQEREDLQSSLTGASVVVSAPGAGYFYQTVDGYEEIFTAQAAKSLTVDGFEELLRASADESVVKKACGKITASPDWYLAVSLDKRSASAYKEGNSYSLLFPYSAGITVEMTLERKASQTNREQVILFFRSSSLPEGFDFTRKQTVRLVAGTYSGIRVSTDALRMLDGELGCYVLDGTRVVFKKAEVLYRDEEMAVCRIPYNSIRDTEEDRGYISMEYLSLYDTVILSAGDLYVGKVLQ